MARELGADERMVAVLQYLRVLLIVVLMPVVATGLYGASPGAGPGRRGGARLAGRRCCSPSAAVRRAGGRPPRCACRCGPARPDAGRGRPRSRAAWVTGRRSPALVGVAAFLVIGLQVGLSFTRESLATIGRALPLALAVIVGLIAASAGLGAVLAATTGASPLDGYLATTPGGLYAVLATATDSGADTTFVLAVQVLRLFVMLLSAPLVARVLRRRGGTLSARARLPCGPDRARRKHAVRRRSSRNADQHRGRGAAVRGRPPGRPGGDPRGAAR